jgi:hypothetical protein
MKKIILVAILGLSFGSLHAQNRMFSSQNNQKNANSTIVSNNIVLNQIVYSQSSIFTSNLAATNSKMTNGISAETRETGTNSGSNEWIKMDLGAVTNVKSVVIGCDFNNNLEGGWGKSYTENKIVQYSSDNINWVQAFNTGNFTQGIQTFNFIFSARYIRIISSGWLSVTEFYATGN